MYLRCHRVDPEPDFSFGVSPFEGSVVPKAIPDIVCDRGLVPDPPDRSPEPSSGEVGKANPGLADRGELPDEEEEVAMVW